MCRHRCFSRLDYFLIFLIKCGWLSAALLRMFGGLQTPASLPPLITPMRGCRDDSAGLAAAARLTRLTRLAVCLDHMLSAGRTDAGWTALLSALPALRRLRLSFEQGVTDKTLAAIAALSTLEDLSLDRAYAVTDDGLGQLSRLGSLSALQLHETRGLTDAGLQQLAALEGLQVSLPSDLL